MLKRGLEVVAGSRARFGLKSLVSAASAIGGLLVLLVWAGFLAVLFLAPNAGMAVSLVLLGVVALSSLLSVFANRAAGLVALVAAAMHVGVWLYFKIDFDTTMADSLYFLLVGALYLTPPLSGGFSLAAGLLGRRSARGRASRQGASSVAAEASDTPAA